MQASLTHWKDSYFQSFFFQKTGMQTIQDASFWNVCYCKKISNFQLRFQGSIYGVSFNTHITRAEEKIQFSVKKAGLGGLWSYLKRKMMAWIRISNVSGISKRSRMPYLLEMYPRWRLVKMYGGHYSKIQAQNSCQ